MQIQWKLDSTLRQHRKTPLALARASGLSKTTVYNIVHGKAKGIELETLDKIMFGLEKLTGQKILVQDVLNRETKIHPILEEILKTAQPFDFSRLEQFLPTWTEEEKKADEQLWKEYEIEKQIQMKLQQQRELELDQLFEDSTWVGTT
jgi:DNA-binding Xre family transcriptional regulator